jgi:type I restriction enzyme S subunit
MTAVGELLTENIGAWIEAVKPKASTGRGRGSGIELYGVKKLRELILDLALRGLLVPQDCYEEAAVKQIERFKVEKSRLILSGALRKEKSLHQIEANEVGFELPSGWEVARLATVSVLITKGTTPTSVGFQFESTGVSFIKIENIDDGVVDRASISQYISEETNQALSRSRLESGDLLFSIAGTIGKIALVRPDDLPANTNQALAIIRGTAPVFVPEFLRYALDSFVAAKTRDKARGGAMPNVSLGDLSVLVAPIPPIQEQHRIVAKVDELMALCDQLEAQQADAIEAHKTLVTTLLDALTKATEQEGFDAAWARVAEHFDTLFTTEWSVDRLEQTILQLAARGLLVKQDPNDEPASELLERMLREKAHLVESKLIRKRKPLDAIDESEWPYAIPKGWAYSRLDDLGDWGAGATPSRKGSGLYDGDIPWFKSGELNADVIVDSEEHVTEKALETCSLRLNQAGDVLVAMYGATIGKASILGVQATTNQAVCAGTVFGDFFNRYLLLLLRTYRQRLIQMGAGGAQPNISREKIIAVVVPVPPLAEQHRIVAKVDELMALCNQLKSVVREAQQTQLSLADTITERAVN